jgi:Cu-processing system permease protein
LKRTDVIVGIARKELTDRFRNRWVVVVSGLLVSFQRSGMTMVSLINLATYLVPLLALSLGSFVVIDEKTNGTLDLLLSFPLTRDDYLVGTFLGLTLALGAAILFGFGAAGAILLGQGGIVTLVDFLIFLILTFGLGVIFLAVSYVISIVSRDRGKALAVALFSWIGAVFLFDILLVGALILSGGKISANLLGVLLLLNPVDLFRLLAYAVIEGARAPIGFTSVDLPELLPIPLLFGVFATWSMALLFLVRRMFRQRIGGDFGSPSMERHP